MALETKKLREMDNAELELHVAELEKEMFDLRQRLTTKEEPNTARVRDLRRDYARVLTIIREKKLAAS